VSQVAIPIKSIVTKISIIMLICASITLIVLARNDSRVTSALRTTVTDVVVPLVGIASKPVDAFNDFTTFVREIMSVHEENQRLREQNAKLMQWQMVATEMEAENNSLRQLLKFAPANKQAYTSARIAGDPGSPYSRSALISSGANQNVEEDQAVISNKGLVGRILDVGDRSSRVLLLTDINSRIPVMSETSRERSILAGNNTDLLNLEYVPEDSKLQVGERIVTSSDGGTLPPGLPVGVVSSIEGGIITVRPLVDWYHLEYVSVVDFSM